MSGVTPPRIKIKDFSDFSDSSVFVRVRPRPILQEFGNA